jgi:hypothetical protein
MNNRKWIKALLAGGLALSLLAGCEDASANVSGKNDMVMRIGNTTVTHGDIYQGMMSRDSAAAVVTTAKQQIIAAEVETTDEIQAKADETYDNYRSQIEATLADGTTFEEAITDYGFTGDDDFRLYCLTDAKTSYLYEKYIDENWDTLVADKSPVKARMIFIDASSIGTELAYSKAEEALALLKGGTAFADVALQYSDKLTLADEALYFRDDSSLDYMVLQFLTTATTTTLSDIIANNDVTGYYIVQITNINAQQMKDDIVAKLESDSDFSDTVFNYYFKKHAFTVYDIDVYNQLKADYPELLVQDEEQTADSTAE